MHRDKNFGLIVLVLVLGLVITGCSDRGNSSQYKIKTATSGEGTIKKDPKGPYESKTEVTLTAKPAKGWKFSKWKGNLEGSNPKQTVTVKENLTVKAEFIDVPTISNLEVTKEGDKVNLSCSVQESNEEVKGVKIKWGDGSETEKISSEFKKISREHTYEDKGEYTVKIIATNQAGNKRIKEEEIVIGNTAPKVNASLKQINGGRVKLTGSVTDKTGDISTVKVIWREGESQLLNKDETNDYQEISVINNYQVKGTHTVKIIATDEQGNTTEEKVKEIEITNSLPTKPKQPQPADKEVIYADSGSAEVTLAWKKSTDNDKSDTIEYDVYFWANNESRAKINDSKLEKAEFELPEELNCGQEYHWQVVATDGKAEVKSKEWTFTMVKNIATEIDLSLETAPLQATLAGSITDTNNNLANVKINWGDGKTETIAGELTEKVISHNYNLVEDYSVEVSVTEENVIDTDKKTKDTIPVKAKNIVTEKLVTYFDFDEEVTTGSSDDVLSCCPDESGNGNKGEANGGIYFNDQNGVLDLDGNDDYLGIADTDDINEGIHKQRTISFWFRPDDLQKKQVLYEEGGRHRGLNIYLKNGKLYYCGWNEVESSWGHSSIYTSEITADDWHHAVLVLDGTEEVESGALAAYLNGELIDTREGSQLWEHGGDIGIGAVNADTKFVSGDCDQDNGYYFDGTIDEFRIYNKVLGKEKIKKLAEEKR